MRKLILAAGIAATMSLASVATAGSLADPVVEMPIVVADAQGSSSGTTIVAMLALLMVVPLVTD